MVAIRLTLGGAQLIILVFYRESTIGASAIILDKEIDRGPLVAREKFKPPLNRADLDQFLVTQVVRACLLLKVLNQFQDSGSIGFEN